MVLLQEQANRILEENKDPRNWPVFKNEICAKVGITNPWGKDGLFSKWVLETCFTEQSICQIPKCKSKIMKVIKTTKYL